MTDRLITAIAEEIGVTANELSFDTKLSDYDTLDRTCILFAVEEEFDCRVDDDEAEKWATVGDIQAWLDTTKATP